MGRNAIRAVTMVASLLAAAHALQNSVKMAESQDADRVMESNVAQDASASKSRQAVVLMVRGISSGCFLKRVIALAKTCSTPQYSRDVWVLYDKSNPVEDPSIRHMLEMSNIRYEPQVDIPESEAWSSFGDVDSGLTKPSFLMWASNKPEYEYFWHMEDDVFYTGEWGEFFDAHNSTADLVGKYHDQPMLTWNWFKGCTVKGRPCVENSETRMQFMWMVSRISFKFVTAIKKALSHSDGRFHGHHEALTPSFCLVSKWCSMQQLEHLGAFHGFGAGDFTVKQDMDLKNVAKLLGNDIEEGLLYHPVKCEAGHNVGNHQLAYANMGGWWAKNVEK